MAIPPRVPPRFVPTLTEVVQVSETQPLRPAPAQAPRTTTISAPHTAPPAVVTASPTRSPDAAKPSREAPPLAPMAPQRAGAPSPVTPARAPSGGPAVPQPGVGAARVGASRPSVASVASGKAPHSKLSDGTEEYIVHRVMQRVDVVLEKRLREAIAAVVQEQTRSVLPRLREEIESVVRQAVYEAVADELASATTVPSSS